MDLTQLSGASHLSHDELDTLTRAQLPLNKLYDYLVDYYYSEVEAETAFRAEAKRRNISQFATEKVLRQLQDAANVISLEFVPRSGLDVYKNRSTAEHVVPNFLLAGHITLLHGHSGHGKSTLVKQALHSVLTGHDFIGSQVIKGDALLIELDEPTDWAMETLIDKMGLPERDAERLHVVDILPDAKRGDESVRLYLRKNPDVRLVVIDALQNFSGVENMNDNSEVGTAMYKLRNLSKEFKNVAIAVIHHSNKDGGFLGAQAIKANVDLQYRFVMDETQENTNFLLNEKWRVIPRQQDLCLRWERDTHLYTIGAERVHFDRRRRDSDAKENEIQDRILDALAENPDGLTKTALSIATKSRGRTYPLLEKVLNVLRTAGEIEAGTDNKYRVTAPARPALAQP